MEDFSIFEDFYLDGPMGCNEWSIYLCCGKQAIYVSSANAKNPDPNITCFCDKHIFLNVKMESTIIKKKKFILVKASVTGYPDVSFVIGQDIAHIIRKGFEQDVKINKKSYNNLVQCLSKDARSEDDNMECIALVQGFVIYIVWTVLALCGQNVGQNSFSTLLAQLGSGITAYGTKIPCITLRTYESHCDSVQSHNVMHKKSGKKSQTERTGRYIKCGESLVKSLTAYKLMLTLDTIHQTLFTCNPGICSWIQICLLWNRCVRAFFYKDSDIEADLSSSMMYGMVMSFSGCIPKDDFFKGAKMLPYLGKSNTPSIKMKNMSSDEHAREPVHVPVHETTETSGGYSGWTTDVSDKRKSEHPSEPSGWTSSVPTTKKHQQFEEIEEKDYDESENFDADNSKRSSSSYSSEESSFIASSFSPSPYNYPISQKRKKRT